MHYAFRVAVLYCVDNDLSSLTGFGLGKMVLLEDQVEELSSTHQFHYEAHVLLVLEDIEEAHNIGVVNLFQYLNLRLYGYLVLFRHILLRHYLHGDLFPGRSVLSFLYRGKTPLSYCAFDPIKVFDVALPSVIIHFFSMILFIINRYNYYKY